MDQIMPDIKGPAFTRRSPSKAEERGGALSTGNNVLANGFQEYKEGYQKLTQNPVSKSIRTFLNHTVIPTLLMLFTPNLVMVLWYTAVYSDGSLSKTVQLFYEKSFIGVMWEIWGRVAIGSSFVLSLLLCFSAWALSLMIILPGSTVEGPVTPKGNVPRYKDNGFLYFIFTVLTFFIMTACLKLVGLTPSIVYDRFGDILATLNLFSFLFCAVLYFKGMYFPSTSDSGSTGNVIFDYYWGTELYPRIFGFDVKVFTNCRFGMMVWALLALAFNVKSYEMWGFVDSMFVSTVLQLIYITKFFWWEAGYLRTIDIMLDRAGFYICWGCLVYVTGFYTSVSLYLVNHPVQLGPFWSPFLLVAGVASIWINYEADMQKQEVRTADGDCLVWGKKPDIIRAKYLLDTGEVKESILLASGWWGLSRHFHYIPEILLAFCWTAPALFNHVMPYGYLFHLLILLTHRSYRDDSKCGKKYGTFWREYCRKVPHRIVPYLF